MIQIPKQAREELKQLLQQSGMADKGITDKSLKMLGVTSMMAAGLSAEEVALHGRWKSAEMPLRYKHNSADYKLSISGGFPSRVAPAKHPHQGMFFLPDNMLGSADQQ